jgi:hypothetical protein
MDLNPVRRIRERRIAQDVAKEFMRNVTSAETEAPQEPPRTRSAAPSPRLRVRGR